MARYRLDFFDSVGCLDRTFTLNAISDETVREAATAVLSSTPYMFVEAFDGDNLLYLMGKAAERMSAA